jgi:hypothetical protein
MRKLLAVEELGDRKPIALLRDMTKCFRDPTAQLSEFFKQLYLDKLPENIRNILALSQHNTTVEVLAKQADQIYDSGNHTTTNQVHAINATARPNNLSNQTRPIKQEAEITLFSIFKMITDMTAKVATLESQMRHLNSTVGNTQDRGYIKKTMQVKLETDHNQTTVMRAIKIVIQPRHFVGIMKSMQRRH